jgi:hypothetical protein
MKQRIRRIKKEHMIKENGEADRNYRKRQIDKGAR